MQGVISALHLSQPHAPAVNDVSTSALIKSLVQCLIPAEMIGATCTCNPLDMNTIIICMSSLLPLFARCRLDFGLHMMVLVQLLKHFVDNGAAAPIMQGLMVQYMPRAMFDVLYSQLVGITGHNLAEVEACLWQMGNSYTLPRVLYGSPAPPAIPPAPVPV